MYGTAEQLTLGVGRVLGLPLGSKPRSKPGLSAAAWVWWSEGAETRGYGMNFVAHNHRQMPHPQESYKLGFLQGFRLARMPPPRGMSIGDVSGCIQVRFDPKKSTPRCLRFGVGKNGNVRRWLGRPFVTIVARVGYRPLRRAKRISKP